MRNLMIGCLAVVTSTVALPQQRVDNQVLLDYLALARYALLGLSLEGSPDRLTTSQLVDCAVKSMSNKFLLEAECVEGCNRPDEDYWVLARDNDHYVALFWWSALLSDGQRSYIWLLKNRPKAFNRGHASLGYVPGLKLPFSQDIVQRLRYWKNSAKASADPVWLAATLLLGEKVKFDARHVSLTLRPMFPVNQNISDLYPHFSIQDPEWKKLGRKGQLAYLATYYKE